MSFLFSPSVMSNSFVTPWNVAYQAPLSLGFSWQEYWSRLPFPPPGDLPDPRIKLASLMSPALARGFFTTSATCKAYFLQGIFPSHRLNPNLPHCREILYQLSHHESPTLGYIYLYELRFSLDMCPGVELPDHIEALFFFKGYPYHSL